MIDALFGDSNYVAAKKMLDVNVLRHEAIASNMANVETPNYKRLDVSPSFESPVEPGCCEPGCRRKSPDCSRSWPWIVRPFPGARDGNTVQLETEMLKLNQNMVEHALETQLVSSQLMRMRLAITGKN